ncbi:MAG: hypothetical protein HKO14_05265 [Silicimonas sp.]|nr:hypothetical protein [Silicimonas sp.]
MTGQSIKTRADGSIDTDFYIRRGRHMRSLAAHEMVGSGAHGADHAPGRRWFHNLVHRLALG